MKNINGHPSLGLKKLSRVMWLTNYTPELKTYALLDDPMRKVSNDPRSPGTSLVNTLWSLSSLSRFFKREDDQACTQHFEFKREIVEQAGLSYTGIKRKKVRFSNARFWQAFDTALDIWTEDFIEELINAHMSEIRSTQGRDESLPMLLDTFKHDATPG